MQFSTSTPCQNANPAKKQALRLLSIKYKYGQQNPNKEEMPVNFVKNLPPIERKQDGTLPRMTPSQRKRANALICIICCNYYEGDCLLLDRACVQSISYTVLCKFFRHVLLEDKAGQALKAELFRDKSTKRCAVCGKVFQRKLREGCTAEAKGRAYPQKEVRCRKVGPEKAR